MSTLIEWPLLSAGDKEWAEVTVADWHSDVPVGRSNSWVSAFRATWGAQRTYGMFMSREFTQHGVRYNARFGFDLAWTKDPQP